MSREFVRVFLLTIYFIREKTLNRSLYKLGKADGSVLEWNKCKLFKKIYRIHKNNLGCKAVIKLCQGLKSASGKLEYSECHLDKAKQKTRTGSANTQPQPQPQTRCKRHNKVTLSIYTEFQIKTPHSTWPITSTGKGGRSPSKQWDPSPLSVCQAPGLVSPSLQIHLTLFKLEPLARKEIFCNYVNLWRSLEPFL